MVRLSPDDLSDGMLMLAGAHRASAARIAWANAAEADVPVAIHVNHAPIPRLAVR